jgi:predicted oxidoreductase
LKYTTNYKRGNDAFRQQVTYTGNNVKSMHLSVEASLRKLRTSYIDILYVHWWDWETSVEEVMNGLHVLVQQGKVLYLVRVHLYRLRHSLMHVIGRASLTLPLGLYPKRTSMLATMENLRL